MASLCNHDLDHVIEVGKMLYFCIIYFTHGLLLWHVRQKRLGSTYSSKPLASHHTGPDLCKYAEHAKHDLSLLFFDLKIRGLEFRPLSIDTPLNLGIHAKIAMMPDQTERSLTSSYLHTPFAARFSASDMIWCKHWRETWVNVKRVAHRKYFETFLLFRGKLIGYCKKGRDFTLLVLTDILTCRYDMITRNWWFCKETSINSWSLRNFVITLKWFGQVIFHVKLNLYSFFQPSIVELEDNCRLVGFGWTFLKVHAEPICADLWKCEPLIWPKSPMHKCCKNVGLWIILRTISTAKAYKKIPWPSSWWWIRNNVPILCAFRSWFPYL